MRVHSIYIYIIRAKEARYNERECLRARKTLPESDYHWRSIADAADKWNRGGNKTRREREREGEWWRGQK